ncbi:Methyltransferase domain-containing protein [Desulfuromusa kysingii]|uniref:Methyltransferase domain-containing protein n=1 Tax=Desulfuromusa kysingii TaxID=37625 RepID=A0A1H4BMB1_9BACT|nr:class I SAM-dependent methyltransferase [Desulfuromusa kysingii]SEA49246.1 Methyltransferase domain-containing protein [Desulfuromusa kysingii]
MDKTAITINSYNESAECFAAKFMDFAPYKNKILHFQENYASHAKSLIDLGCGPGNVSKIFFDQNPSYEITGFDLSEEMVNQAKQNVPNGQFYVGDLRSIDLQETYDIAIASFCIVHLSNKETEKFIQNISKIINHNGYLYLSFMEGNKTQYEATCFSEKEIYFNYFKRAVIIKLLEKAGFEIKEISEQNYKEDSGETTKDLFVFAQKAT